MLLPHPIRLACDPADRCSWELAPAVCSQHPVAPVAPPGIPRRWTRTLRSFGLRRRKTQARSVRTRSPAARKEAASSHRFRPGTARTASSAPAFVPCLPCGDAEVRRPEKRQRKTRRAPGARARASSRGRSGAADRATRCAAGARAPVRGAHSRPPHAAHTQVPPSCDAQPSLDADAGACLHLGLHCSGSCEDTLGDDIACR